MFGSWNLGRFAGIDVRIHWTFLLLPLYIYFSSLVAGSGVVAASVAVLLLLAIFGCVVLHEYGHALTARQFGIPTRDITLLPIGGVARLERMPRSPLQELAIAVAGPAVNVVIAAGLFVALALPPVVAALPVAVASFLTQLAWVNVALVVFNMLPAFPMDGGRVLRAVLAMVLPYAAATRAAAGVGQVAAIGLALLGLFSGNFVLVLLAGFVFLAARGEVMMVRQQDRAASAWPPQTAETAAGPAGATWSQPAATAPYASPSDPAGHHPAGHHPASQGWGSQTASHQPAGGSAPLRSLPVVSAAWNARHVLSWLASAPVEEFLVASGGVVIGIVHKRDLSEVVRAGLGTLSLERLLAGRQLPFHDVRGGSATV